MHDRKNASGRGERAEPVRTEPVESLGTSDQCALPGIERGELLKRARTRAAWDFTDEIEARWQKNQSCSRRLLAERHIGCDETTIRAWCSGDKPIPLGALELLPEDFAIALVKRIFARRGIKL